MTSWTGLALCSHKIYVGKYFDEFSYTFLNIEYSYSEWLQLNFTAKYN